MKIKKATTHCTIFTLSQPNNPLHSKLCSHTHDVFCESIKFWEIFSTYSNNGVLNYCPLNCFSIAQLFDPVEDGINTVVNEETKSELIYDLKLISSDKYVFFFLF